MGSSATVRDAVAGDVKRIAELHRAMGLEMADSAPDGFGETMREQPPVDEIAVQFTEALADEDSTLLVAELDGEVAAFLLLVIERNTDDLITAPFATIQYIATVGKAPGKGLGKLLMVEAEKRAAALGIATIDLLVWSGNEAAIGLYKKLGYLAIEQRMAKRLGE